MITVDIFGGLGNQMFQYALGRHLALKTGSSLTLRHIDVGAFSKREYALGCFKLAKRVQVKSEVRGLMLEFTKVLEKIFPLGRGETFVREKSFRFDPKILKLNGSTRLAARGKNIHLHGYWQSEKYFKDIRETILEDFTPVHPLSGRNQKVLEEIERSNSVSVHVRRGDYVIDPKTHKFHGVCGPDYYRKAVEIVAKRVREPVFYFFSDDIDWVKKNLKTRFRDVYVDWNTGEQSYLDMQLMSRCKHHILANSSFSWWGAWLNRNPDKIVIAPERWFQDQAVDTRDLIPEGWLRVK
uniref:Alpha-1,2-fucosyltransferase n=1 Tax=candidate division WWE3 bacterium TaxID=2053526 RepID=A0A832DRW5_UNCKA